MTQRFEITGTATDVWTCDEIRTALRVAGAQKVGARRAFGMSNQPRVATFTAADQAEADRLANAARERLPYTSSLPGLHAFPIK